MIKFISYLLKALIILIFYDITIRLLNYVYLIIKRLELLRLQI